jgi:hypothetical protein
MLKIIRQTFALFALLPVVSLTMYAWVLIVNYKRLICIALPLAIGVSFANADEIGCHTEQLFKDGEKRITDLKLILEQDRIVGLIFYDIDSFVAKGNPMAIWECSVDTTHPDKDHQIKWSRTANKTVLEIIEKESQEKSLVKIEKHVHGYKIFFFTMSRYYSGNSEFPESVVIEKGKKQCTVVYRKP